MAGFSNSVGGTNLFSLNTINNYYIAKSNLKHVSSTAFKQNVPTTTTSSLSTNIPPWLERKSKTEETEAQTVARLLSAKSFIDINARTLASSNDPAETNMFNLYRGMTRLEELASYANSGKSASSISTALNQTWKSAVSEIRSFLDKTDFGDVTILPGTETSSVKSTMTYTKEQLLPTFTGNIAASDRTSAIAGLVGNETFTITSKTAAGNTYTANIDFSQITGTLDIDAVADHINTQMSNSGMGSYVTVKRMDETDYRLEFTMGTGETMTFGGASTSAAVYVGGNAGEGIYQDAYMKKFTDVASGTPSNEWSYRVSGDGNDNLQDSVVDADGNVYVVGSASQNIDGEEVTASANDAFLTKYDSAGNVEWTRLLGAKDSAAGYAVALDSNNNIIVAGTTTDLLTDTAYGSGKDAFVTKFDSTGVEQWTRQAAPFADDGAMTLTVDSSDNIYLGGYTNAAITDGKTYGGGSDAFVTKLDSSGTLAWNKQYGGTGTERVVDMTTDASGNIIVLAEEDGNAVVRKFANDSSDTPTWTMDLGSLGTGTAAALAIDSSTGEIYVTGSSSNAAIGGGTTAQAHSGGTDAFVVNITDAGASATVDWTSFVGSASEDEAVDITVNNGTIHIAGNTEGQLGSAQYSSRDGFAVEMNSSGITQWTEQFATTASSINYDADGASVLDKLGLPSGTPSLSDPNYVSVNTTARPGDYFYIQVNDNTRKRITIEEGDTMGWLNYKINSALGGYGSATVDADLNDSALQIEALNGNIVKLIPGPEGSDALKGLGFKETTLVGDTDDVPAGTTTPADSVFFLGLFDDLNLLDADAAQNASFVASGALKEIRDAFKTYKFGPQPEEDPLAAFQNQGTQATVYQTTRANAYQAALDRLSAGTPTSVFGQTFY